MAKMNWDRVRTPRTDIPTPDTYDSTKLVARYAAELRTMTTSAVERIAKDSSKNGAHRAAAWRELKRRRPAPPPRPAYPPELPAEGLPWDEPTAAV